jgi:hypothetical protein
MELKARGINSSDEEMKLLLMGVGIDAGAKKRLFYWNGRLQEKSMRV